MSVSSLRKRIANLEAIGNVASVNVDDMFPFELRTYQQQTYKEFCDGRKYFLLCLPRRS